MTPMRRRSPSTCSRAGAPRPTARRSSRSTSTGSRPRAASSRTGWPGAGSPLTYLAFVASAVGGRARSTSDPERVDRRRRARLPRRRQPRDRGGARVGADRAGDPAGPAAQPRGPGERDRRARPARAQGGSRPTTSPAARSRSPTPVSSARCSRRRSSTSPRSGSSTWRRSSSGRWSIDDDRRRSRPADDQPLHVVGPPGARRRRGGAIPRRRQGPARGVGAMSLLAHEEVVVRHGERSGIYVVIAIHSTALGPALGGLRLWRYASARRRDRRRAPALRGDDLQGGRRRARPRRRQGGDLPAPRGRAAARAAAGADARRRRHRRVARRPLRDGRGRRDRHRRHVDHQGAHRARHRPSDRLRRVRRSKPDHGTRRRGRDPRER